MRGNLTGMAGRLACFLTLLAPSTCLGQVANSADPRPGNLVGVPHPPHLVAIPQGSTTTVRLPRTSLKQVPAELVEPIGVPPRNQPVWAKLRSQRININAEAMPLGDLADFLRNETKLNFVIDGTALEEEGVTVGTPITTEFTEARLGEAIERVLRQLNLTYVVRDEVVIITSQLAAGNELTVRVYPVGDLVLADAESRELGRMIDADSLIQIIEWTVSPNSWSSVGGAGSIEVFYGNLSLAVLQTDAVHDDVAAVLEMLRRGRGGAAPDDAAKQAARPATPTPVLGVPEAESRIRGTLRDRRATLEFVDTPLVEVIEFLESFTKIDFDLDRVALEEEGVTPDTPVTFRVNDVSLESAINLMLRPLNLSWVVDNEVVEITSMLSAGNELVTRCYPVGDLVMVGADDERWSDSHDDLIQIIEATTVPNSWSSVGGAGTLDFFAGSQCLVAHQTQAAHDHIAALLAMLRESGDRLPGIARALGLPVAEKLIEARLRSVREELRLAEANDRKGRQMAEQLEEHRWEELTDPNRAKTRMEAKLLVAQTSIAEKQLEHQAELQKAQLAKIQAESAAFKAQADLADTQRKQLSGAGSADSDAAICPHCKKPLRPAAARD